MIEANQLRAAGEYPIAAARRIGEGIMNGISKAISQPLVETSSGRLKEAVREPKVLGAGAVLAVAVPPVIAAARRRSQSPKPVPLGDVGAHVLPDSTKRAMDNLIEHAERVPGREIGGPSELD